MAVPGKSWCTGDIIYCSDDHKKIRSFKTTSRKGGSGVCGVSDGVVCVNDNVYVCFVWCVIAVCEVYIKCRVPFLVTREVYVCIIKISKLISSANIFVLRRCIGCNLASLSLDISNHTVCACHLVASDLNLFHTSWSFLDRAMSQVFSLGLVSRLAFQLFLTCSENKEICCAEWWMCGVGCLCSTLQCWKQRRKSDCV